MSMKKLALYKKRLLKKIEAIEDIERREEECRNLLEHASDAVGRVTRQEWMGSTTYHAILTHLGKAGDNIHAWRQLAADSRQAKYKFSHVPTTFHDWLVTEDDPNTWVRIVYANTHLYYYFVKFGGDGIADIVNDGLLATLPKLANR